MEFTIPEELRTLRDSLRRFLQREIIPLEESYRQGKILPDTVPFEEHLKVRRRSREVGFYGIAMPEEVGGGGISNVGMALLNEELGVQPVDIFYSCIFGGAGGPTPILTACTAEQRVEFLDPLMRVEKSCCFGLTEPEAGSDAASIRSTAVRDGDYYILNGQKHFISNAPYADFGMIFAVTDKDKRAKGGITCFLVDMKSPGVTVKVQDTMLRDDLQGEIFFEDVRVPVKNVLGRLGYGFAAAMEWIAHGRMSLGATAVGITQRVLDMSVQYAKQRVQFGKPISHRQAIQWKLADMATQLYAARMMVYHAAWKLDQREETHRDTSMVKVFCTETCFQAVDTAIQIHGGMGYMRELPLERIFRRIRAWRIVEGTSEIQRWIIARSLLGNEKEN